jgi:hypothetical protein
MTNGNISKLKVKITKSALRSGALAAMLALMAGSASAGTLTYIEAVSGDLPESSNFPILALDVGVNTVSGTGSVNFPVGGPNSADFDSFKFTVPTGTVLTAITYTSTVTLDTTNEPSLRMEAFIDTLGPLVAVACQEFYIINQPATGPTCLVPPGNTFNSPLPLGAGTYLLFEGQFQPTQFGETDWNYTWTLTVQAVPEPASITLMCAGIALLGMAAVRRSIRL